MAIRCTAALPSPASRPVLRGVRGTYWTPDFVFQVLLVGADNFTLLGRPLLGYVLSHTGLGLGPRAVRWQ